MREFKFRYVYKHKETGRIFKRIFDISEIEVGEVVQKLFEEFKISGYDLISRDQFTGLKDIEGKDIYENDILEAFDNDEYRKIVCFDDGSFKLNDTPESEINFHIVGSERYIKECKIKTIGTTHE